LNLEVKIKYVNPAVTNFFSTIFPFVGNMPMWYNMEAK